ncbi:MAG TPA: chemotaxis protein CheW [Steroidobacteraceae bacterium]|nr:chemotaxis protein CheW [Steroidobacteraceae bacterium]
MQTEPQFRAGRFLTFRVAGQLYALRSEDVLEVIRVPALARVPQGPPALLGIANLRGAVLPITGLRQLLGKPSAASDIASARAIVLDIGAPIAVAVDSVATLEYASAEQIDTRPKEVGADGAERLRGVLSVAGGQEVAKILDLEAMLETAFANRARVPQSGGKPRVAARAHEERRAAQETENLVTFDVAGQEFALPLADVQEIIPAPAGVIAVAHSEATVLGLTAVRDTLLPLLSLRSLLGLPARQTESERQKVVVVKVAGARVGLVADRARAVIAADTRLVDPIPPALAARTGGESRIRSVYRGEAGRRLISILSPQQLFRDDVMQKLTAGEREFAASQALEEYSAREELTFLVFRLGGDELGLPIDAVVEVARIPEQITRLPKTPKFLEGVVNLRGDVLPVIDQRRRFDMPPLENTDGRRLIVVRTERHRAGIIVDGVSDVLRSSANAIEPAPQLTEETSRLVRGVINLAASNRMVLLLDPMELLTRAERGLLDKFEAQRQRTGA